MAQTWVFLDPTVEPLLIFLLQMALTLFITRVLGRVLQLAKEPQVIGEVIGGIILGPSVLGHIPGFTQVVFPTAVKLANGQMYNSLTTFNVIASVGLILFMFIMGAELDQQLLRREWRRSLPIGISAIVIPFCTGAAASVWLRDVNAEKQPASWAPPSNVSFLLFFGASMSFTAFPVLASILNATKLLSTPLGVLAVATAAIDDVTAWCVLAIATSFAAHGSALDGFYTCCLAVAFVLAMAVLYVVLHWLHGALGRHQLADSRYYFCFLVLLLIGAAYTTEVIGIHAFFGAFVMGIITPKTNGFLDDLLPRMELVVTEVLLPLYFVNSGLRTDINSLNTARDWGITLVIILLACIAKFLPTCLVCKLVTRRSWRFSTSLGFLMNTRGLVELIALNIGLSMGILSIRLFTMMVLMAIVTTVLTSPALWAVYLRKFPDGVENKADAQEQALHESSARSTGHPAGSAPVVEAADGQGPAAQLTAASSSAGPSVHVALSVAGGNGPADGAGNQLSHRHALQG